MRIAILVFALLASASASFSQCKSWIKSDCRPLLEEYTGHRFINDTRLQPGDETQIMLTFYARQQYRLVVCHEEQLGDVHFIVSDTDENAIFDSSTSENSYFDFKVGATQQLLVKIVIPEKENLVDNYAVWGCVAVVTGIKED